MNTHRTTRRRAQVLAAVTLCTALVGGGQLIAHAHDGHESGASARFTGPQRIVVRQATSRFRDVDAAIEAGYLPTDTCSELPGVGGMGYHFVNPTLASDARIDPTQPEILLYTKNAAGDFTLAGVEWFAADADQDLTTDGDRPTMFGHPFDGPMPGHEAGMPAHYDLHAWVYVSNPSGQLSAWNPRVACPTP